MLFLQVGEFNPAFEHFLKFINGIKYRGKSKAPWQWALAQNLTIFIASLMIINMT